MPVFSYSFPKKKSPTTLHMSCVQFGMRVNKNPPYASGLCISLVLVAWNYKRSKGCQEMDDYSMYYVCGDICCHVPIDGEGDLEEGDDKPINKADQSVTATTLLPMLVKSLQQKAASRPPRNTITDAPALSQEIHETKDLFENGRPKVIIYKFEGLLFQMDGSRVPSELESVQNSFGGFPTLDDLQKHFETIANARIKQCIFSPTYSSDSIKKMLALLGFDDFFEDSNKHGVFGKEKIEENEMSSIVKDVQIWVGSDKKEDLIFVDSTASQHIPIFRKWARVYECLSGKLAIGKDFIALRLRCGL